MNSSLYIHIPFCKKKCAYCDFFSIGEQDRNGRINDLSDSYISSLLAEAKFYAEFYKITGWNTVYTGGGTPSLLSPNQIFSLISGVQKIAPLAENAEVTVEVNPDDVSKEFLDSCTKAGVNRISMGIQALDDKALDAVGRGSSVQIVLNALETLNQYWDGRLSVDFIAGLPRHTYSSFESQFEILKKYPKIDHVSLYTLTIEENTPLYRQIESGKVNFSYEKADRMWLKGRKILEGLGFEHYEVSNFARKGFESRHNQTYWNQNSYIGIGAGASGTWYHFSESPKALRWTNTLSVPAYQKNAENGNPLRSIEELDEKTLEFEFLMLGFRKTSGVSEKDFYQRFNKPLAERIGAERDDGVFYKWKKNRLAGVKTVENGDKVYFLNRRGILLLNRFLEELI